MLQEKKNIEEYGPEYVHIAGKDNIVADALSRLDKFDEKVRDLTPAQHCAYAMAHLVRDEQYHVGSTDECLAECLAENFATSTEAELEQFPMHPALIAKC